MPSMCRLTQTRHERNMNEQQKVEVLNTSQHQPTFCLRLQFDAFSPSSLWYRYRNKIKGNIRNGWAHPKTQHPWDKERRTHITIYHIYIICKYIRIKKEQIINTSIRSIARLVPDFKDLQVLHSKLTTLSAHPDQIHIGSENSGATRTPWNDDN